MKKPPLREFSRYIELGMVAIVKLVADAEAGGTQSFQFSLTPQQCRQIAADLLMCAQVIEHERPTTPQ
ncbi:hypothetical protein ACIQUB_22145 [Rhizobium sp. NPDC090275]|uniref:hypothetical protein n=1 Tax=Rhizobium sp. NPDC090275 TaxID=3364498 RepID=UPI003839D97C